MDPGQLIAFSWYIAVWVLIREYIYRFHHSAHQYCQEFHLPADWNPHRISVYSWTGTDTGWPLGVKCVFSQTGQGIVLIVNDHFIVAISWLLFQRSWSFSSSDSKSSLYEGEPAATSHLTLLVRLSF